MGGCQAVTQAKQGCWSGIIVSTKIKEFSKHSPGQNWGYSYKRADSAVKDRHWTQRTMKGANAMPVRPQQIKVDATRKKFLSVNKCVSTFYPTVLPNTSCKQVAQVTKLVCNVESLIWSQKYVFYTWGRILFLIIIFYYKKHLELEVFGEYSASPCSVKKQVSCSLT